MSFESEVNSLVYWLYVNANEILQSHSRNEIPYAEKNIIPIHCLHNFNTNIGEGIDFVSLSNNFNISYVVTDDFYAKWIESIFNDLRNLCDFISIMSMK